MSIIENKSSPQNQNIFVVLKEGSNANKRYLMKRKWKGPPKCCFCNSNEIIQHLFFECYLAKFVWRVMHITFNIQPPTSISNMLGPWLKSFPFKLRNRLLVGTTALCWAIWLNRYEVVSKGSYLTLICKSSLEERIGQEIGQYCLRSKRRLI